MPEVSDGIQQLFTVGLTREAFIEKFKQIQETVQENNEESIFNRELSETMIGAMYDSFHKANSGQETTNTSETTTDSDINALASLDGDDTSVSDEDLMHLYEKTLERLQNTEISDDAPSGSNTITTAEALEIYTMQRALKIRLAEIEKVKIQAEIDNLVLNSKGISNELKQEYESAKKNKQTAEENLAKKQKELAGVKNKKQYVSETIERKRGEIDGTDDEDKKKNLQTELNSLLSSAETYEDNQSDIMTEISGLNNTVQVADTRMKSITNKITSNDKTTSKKVKKLQDKIESIDKKLELELQEIDLKIEELKQKQKENMYKAGYEGALYINSFHSYNPNAVNFNSLSEKGLKYSSAKGQRLANDIAGHMIGFSGKCSKYVRQSLQRTGLYNGHTAHAYQMANVLAQNKDFQEISPNDVDLNSLPPGCILVYDTHTKWYSQTSGHIEVTLGDGTAVSDGRTSHLKKADGMRIFVPVENA